jgi:hypothetical protein
LLRYKRSVVNHRKLKQEDLFQQAGYSPPFSLISVEVSDERAFPEKQKPLDQIDLFKIKELTNVKNN